jgi:hypothetical protein
LEAALEHLNSFRLLPRTIGAPSQQLSGPGVARGTRYGLQIWLTHAAPARSVG